MPDTPGWHCKRCGIQVYVAHINGVQSFSVEIGKDKLKEVIVCPHCDNRLLTENDLEFIPPKEAKP